MSNRMMRILIVLAVGATGGIVLYVSQFLGAGPSPAAVQRTLLLREVASTAVLGAAIGTGYVLYGGVALRRSAAGVIGLFLLSGLFGYALGYVALALAPPEGFTLGSHLSTFTLLALREVVPFTVAGFSGAAFRTLRGAGRG